MIKTIVSVVIGVLVSLLTISLALIGGFFYITDAQDRDIIMSLAKGDVEPLIEGANLQQLVEDEIDTEQIIQNETEDINTERIIKDELDEVDLQEILLEEFNLRSTIIDVLADTF